MFTLPLCVLPNLHWTHWPASCQIAVNSWSLDCLATMGMMGESFCNLWRACEIWKKYNYMLSRVSCSTPNHVSKYWSPHLCWKLTSVFASLQCYSGHCQNSPDCQIWLWRNFEPVEQPSGHLWLVQNATIVEFDNVAEFDNAQKVPQVSAGLSLIISDHDRFWSSKWRRWRTLDGMADFFLFLEGMWASFFKNTIESTAIQMCKHTVTPCLNILWAVFWTSKKHWRKR